MLYHSIALPTSGLTVLSILPNLCGPPSNFILDRKILTLIDLHCVQLAEGRLLITHVHFCRVYNIRELNFLRPYFLGGTTGLDHRGVRLDGRGGDVRPIFLINHLALSRRARLPRFLLHDHLSFFLLGPCHLLLHVFNLIGVTSEQTNADYSAPALSVLAVDLRLNRLLTLLLVVCVSTTAMLVDRRQKAN